MGKQGAVSILHVMFVIAQFLRYKRRETIYHRPLSARVAVDTYVCMYVCMIWVFSRWMYILSISKCEIDAS